MLHRLLHSSASNSWHHVDHVTKPCINFGCVRDNGSIFVLFTLLICTPLLRRSTNSKSLHVYSKFLHTFIASGECVISLCKQSPTANYFYAKLSPTARSLYVKQSPTARSYYAKLSPTARSLYAKLSPTARSLYAKLSPTAKIRMCRILRTCYKHFKHIQMCMDIYCASKILA